MALFHINPATGIVLPCRQPKNCNLEIPQSLHYESSASALASFDAERSNNYFLLRNEIQDPDFLEALERAVRPGFVRLSEDSTCFTQTKILLTKTAFKHMIDQIVNSVDAHDRELHAKVLAWAIHKNAKKSHISFKTVFRLEVKKHLPSEGDSKLIYDALRYDGSTPMERERIATDLWLYRDSPYHKVAKALMWSEPFKIDGYIPKGRGYVLQIENDDACRKMNIIKEDLPLNVLSYDIETDTSRGLGLHPIHTQITDIVLSVRDKSWVLSGDERFILKQFAKILNNIESPTLLAGWNNQLFDNIVLQTRAEYHGTEEWNGVLSESENITHFEPVGPSSSSQNLSWYGKMVLQDFDVFQEKTKIDSLNNNYHIIGLKEFVTREGVSPITLERHKMHTYSDRERQEYVLSDGISTLFAYEAIAKDSCSLISL